MNKKGIIGFVLAIIIFNIIIHFTSSNRKDAFKNSLNKINGKISGILFERDSLQQDAGLLRLHLKSNSIGNVNFEEEPFSYLTIQDDVAEVMTIWMSKFQIGDSLLLNFESEQLMNFRDGELTFKKGLDSLFLYKRVPVYFHAKRRKKL